MWRIHCVESVRLSYSISNVSVVIIVYCSNCIARRLDCNQLFCLLINVTTLAFPILLGAMTCTTVYFTAHYFLSLTSY